VPGNVTVVAFCHFIDITLFAHFACSPNFVSLPVLGMFHNGVEAGRIKCEQPGATLGRGRGMASLTSLTKVAVTATEAAAAAAAEEISMVRGHTQQRQRYDQPHEPDKGCSNRGGGSSSTSSSSNIESL
jgi:hypothetical protein